MNSRRCALRMSASLLILILINAGCGPSDSDESDNKSGSAEPTYSDLALEWTGSIDTLASGEIVVHNAGTPLWSPNEAWNVVEEFRIGSDTGDDAIIFGTIRAFDVDAHGRVYVLDNQSQEIHVFDSDGTFLRTIGTEGAGPGEFEEAAAVDINADGEILVMEMKKGRLTVLDPTGIYNRIEHMNSAGWDYWSYPGGLDWMGRYNGAVFSDEEDVDLMFARYDQSFTPLDTIPIPESPVEFGRFEHILDDGASSISAAIPYQSSFKWAFSNSGNFWTLLTGAYELVEITAEGTALRRVTMDFEPIPVTMEDKEEARENLRWFTRQGGEVDLSRIPSTKPVISSFFCDDMGNIWVQRVSERPENENRLFHLFDPTGRFLGDLQLPFALDSNPTPIVRNGALYGMSLDNEGAETIVGARIEMPSASDSP